MFNYKLLDVILRLFEGDGGGATASPASGAQGDTQAAPGSTRRGKTGDNVIYGKQAATAPSEGEGGASEGSDAGSKAEVKTTSNTLEERRKAFRDMVNGEFKDVYAEDTQRIINRRFSETKTLQTQLDAQQPLMDLLTQRYNVPDGDVAKLLKAIESDNALWEHAAEEAGMSVQQYKEFQQMKRDNARMLKEQQDRQGREAMERQLQKWYGEAEQMKTLYPSFDLRNEVQNQRFLSMLQSGVPVQHAYEVLHIDEIKAAAAQHAAKITEKQIVDNVRAKGARPAENGTVSQSAFIVKDDVSKLTKKDRAEIARKAARGEYISF